MEHKLKIMNKKILGCDNFNISQVMKNMTSFQEILVKLDKLKIEKNNDYVSDLYFLNSYLDLFDFFVADMDDKLIVAKMMLGTKNIKTGIINVLQYDEMVSYLFAYSLYFDDTVIYSLEEVKNLIDSNKIVLLCIDKEESLYESDDLFTLSEFENYSYNDDIRKNAKLGYAIRMLLTDKIIDDVKEEYMEEISFYLKKLIGEVNHKVNVYKGRYEYFLDLQSNLENIEHSFEDSKNKKIRKHNKTR